MWLLLCDRSDLSALWAYRALRARGLAFELVSTDVLGYAIDWEHRLGAHGTTIRIRLADGRAVDGGQLQGVLNRIASVPNGPAARADRADREYALQEVQAFWLSWLSGLCCPVLNRPTPLGLGGAWRDRTEWLMLSARAGLATAAYRSGNGDRPRPSRQALVVAGRLVGEAPPDVVAGCRELATLSGTDLLGIEFAADDAWTFVDATPHPDLSVGGERGLDLLAAALRAEPIT
jgi:hypothetical protein